MQQPRRNPAVAARSSHSARFRAGDHFNNRGANSYWGRSSILVLQLTLGDTEQFAKIANRLLQP